MGKAYGFFQCDATLDEIARVLPMVREHSAIPSLVEFLFMNAGDCLLPSPDMMDLLEEGRNQGRNIGAEAFYIGKTHEEAADELALVIQGIYRSGLYHPRESFFGDILFMKNGVLTYRA